MLEQDLYTYLAATFSTYTFFWGKINPETPTNGVIINFFTVGNVGAKLTPSYLNVIQLSVRGEYIDDVQEAGNAIIKHFHLFNGNIGEYKVWVSDVTTNSILYEEENLVHLPIILSVKFTEL